MSAGYVGRGGVVSGNIAGPARDGDGDGRRRRRRRRHGVELGCIPAERRILTTIGQDIFSHPTGLVN